MTDENYALGAISDFLKEHGQDLPDQEKTIETSSDEEVDDDFELRLQLALREQLSSRGGQNKDWIGKFANDSSDSDEDGDKESATMSRKNENEIASDNSLGDVNKKSNDEQANGGTDGSLKSTDASDEKNTDKSVESRQTGENNKKVQKKKAKSVQADNRHVNVDTSVYIGNLPFTATEDELQRAMIAAGKVTKTVIERNSKGKSKGFGYVQFAESSAAAKAVETLHDIIKLGGRTLLVKTFDGEIAKRHVAVKQQQRRTKVKKRKMSKNDEKASVIEQSSTASVNQGIDSSNESNKEPRHKKNKQSSSSKAESQTSQILPVENQEKQDDEKKKKKKKKKDKKKNKVK